MSVPVYAADPAEPATLLDRFLADRREWSKHHQWPAEATYALHEELPLRVELYHAHDAGPRDVIWTVAAYESPVGDRLWHATATAGTPEGVITTLLDSLTDEHDWSSTTWAASTASPDRKAALPLADYSWVESTTETGAAWTSPDGACRLRRDRDNGWEAVGGTDTHALSWAVRFSQHAPPEIVQQLAFELAEGRGPQHGAPRAPRSSASRSVRAAGPPGGLRSPARRGR